MHIASCYIVLATPNYQYNTYENEENGVLKIFELLLLVSMLILDLLTIPKSHYNLKEFYYYSSIILLLLPTKFLCAPSEQHKHARMDPIREGPGSQCRWQSSK